MYVFLIFNQLFLQFIYDRKLRILVIFRLTDRAEIMKAVINISV